MQTNALKRAESVNIVETVFAKYSCPAEIILPYQLYDAEVNGVVSAYRHSRYIPTVWNMDLPWIIAIFGGMALNLFACASIALANFVLNGTSSIGIAFTVMAGSSLILVPLIYALTVYINLTFRYGGKWWQKLMAPSHVGITESGFKLYYRGKFFYNYPNLAVWTDISDVDIVMDSRYNVPSIRFSYSSSYVGKTMILPIHGFASESELMVVLDHLNKHVHVSKQSGNFEALAQIDFFPVRQSYRAATAVPAIDQKENS